MQKKNMEPEPRTPRASEAVRRLFRNIDRRIITPLIRTTARFISDRMPVTEPPLITAAPASPEPEPEPEPAEDSPPLSGWKEETLTDFARWLSELPEAPDVPESDRVPLEAADFHSLLAELTALRQEVRLQNREMNRTTKALEESAEGGQKNREELASLAAGQERIMTGIGEIAGQLNRQEGEHGEALVEKIRQDTEKETVLPFLDMRDALLRGLAAVRSLPRKKGLFRSQPAGMEGVAEGYEMALRRFDRALASVGIHPVDAAGKPFNPATMRALDVRHDPEMEQGVVIEEQFSGFVRGEEVIRTAEVVVNE